jgi:hypothetical protein
MLNLLLPAAIGAVTGATTGGLAAWWLLRRHVRHETQAQPVPADPVLSAQIDQAATAWATAQGRPAAAGLAADKFHLLHRVGQRRGWW